MEQGNPPGQVRLAGPGELRPGFFVLCKPFAAYSVCCGRSRTGHRAQVQGKKPRAHRKRSQGNQPGPLSHVPDRIIYQGG